VDRPFALLAEVTYACPLHCPYCSNPLSLGDYSDELTTQEWQRVLVEAKHLGVLQLHLSGGEPLQRRDLVEIVRTASRLGLYTNLITSGFSLSSRRAELLRAAGLDHVQISFQADEQALSDRIAGTPSFERKRAAARLVKKLGWPLTVNVVLHRYNIDRVDRIMDMAAGLGADRLELANTQYYGWAWRNRDGLLPSRAQVQQAEATVRAARGRLGDRMEIIYVIPDYYSRYPKPCMGGWGRHELTVVPSGDVLPCPTAHALPLPHASVRQHPLAWIWERSPLFQRFRGTGWMPDPCRSCDRREVDFGGCRCQAFQLTGDAARTDPVCHLSPDHGLVTAAVQAANHGLRPAGAPLAFRPQPGRPTSAGTFRPRGRVEDPGEAPE
jgi:PqqA peptide cyclase